LRSDKKKKKKKKKNEEKLEEEEAIKTEKSERWYSLIPYTLSHARTPHST
jgi:hypothetical protein